MNIVGLITEIENTLSFKIDYINVLFFNGKCATVQIISKKFKNIHLNDRIDMVLNDIMNNNKLTQFDLAFELLSHKNESPLEMTNKS